jgi:hypothetical protein
VEIASGCRRLPAVHFPATPYFGIVADCRETA